MSTPLQQSECVAYQRADLMDLVQVGSAKTEKLDGVLHRENLKAKDVQVAGVGGRTGH